MAKDEVSFNVDSHSGLNLDQPFDKRSCLRARKIPTKSEGNEDCSSNSHRKGKALKKNNTSLPLAPVIIASVSKDTTPSCFNTSLRSILKTAKYSPSGKSKMANSVYPDRKVTWKMKKSIVLHQKAVNEPQSLSTRIVRQEPSAVLQKWLDEHMESPYPEKNEKMELANKTGLTFYQVQDWFHNVHKKMKETSHQRNKSGSNQLTTKSEEVPLKTQSNSGGKEKTVIESSSTKQNFSGFSRLGLLPLHSVKVLQEWFDNHKDNPFPTNTERTELIKKSGLTLKQVTHWFDRNRRRHLPEKIRKRPQESSPAESPLPKNSLKILLKWYEDHGDNPNLNEKVALVEETGLTLNQVDSWFICASRRSLPKRTCRRETMSLQGPSEVLLEEQQNYSNSEQGISRESDVVPACPTELAVISEEDENKVLEVLLEKQQNDTNAEQAMNQEIDLLQVVQISTEVDSISEEDENENSDLVLELEESFIEEDLQNESENKPSCSNSSIENLRIEEVMQGQGDSQPQASIVELTPDNSPLRSSQILRNLLTQNQPIENRCSISNNIDGALLKLCHSQTLGDEGSEELLQLIRDKELNVNCLDSNGRTPLRLLCENNKGRNLFNLLDAVRALIDRGVVVDVKASDGSTALLALCACQHDHPDFMAVLRLLVEHGANVNSRDSQGRNALLIICTVHLSDDLVDRIKFLIENQVDVNARDVNGTKAFNLLIRRGFSKSSEVIGLLRRP